MGGNFDVQALVNVPIGSLSDTSLNYTFTFTVIDGPTNTDANPSDNSALITILPSPGARSAVRPAMGAPLLARISMRAENGNLVHPGR